MVHFIKIIDKNELKWNKLDHLHDSQNHSQKSNKRIRKVQKILEGAVNIEYGNIENGNIKFCQESGELKERFRQKCV